MPKIPKEFYSDLEDKPLLNCKVCKVSFIEEEQPYVIEKALKKTEKGEDLTLFELAICMPCAQKQSNKMSQESRLFIQNTMMNEEILQKQQTLLEQGWQEQWNRKCLFTSKTVKPNEEYHIVGYFMGEKVLEGQPPFVMGQDLINYLQENISAETKEEWDNFGREFLGPTNPELKMLLEDYQYTLV